MRALLISTYDLGRQPFGLASPAAWLHAAGWSVDCVDTSRDELPEVLVRGADVIGIFLPMHTATRLALPVIARLRRVNPTVRLCAYGVYAALAAESLHSAGVERVFAGEFERDLVDWANGGAPAGGAAIPRLQFLIPDRSGLPRLDRYATLQRPDGQRRAVGYTEASRGCRHLCRHCPIVPVYRGQFRVVAPEIVLADIASQVDLGAQHITFGDPDFFNGPTHAMRVVDGLHAAYPDLSYDVTIKVEHLLRHRDLLPRLAATGCAFVTSAVESVDDRVLDILDKGHTRAEFVDAVAECRRAGLALVPTFVAFHPWITLDGYCELVDTIEALGLAGHVAPVQLAIRLLIPQGSRLLEVPDVARLVESFDPATLTWRWSHPDPRVDALQREVAALAGANLKADRHAVVARIRELAHHRAGHQPVRTSPARDRATVPYLNEPWYC